MNKVDYLKNASIYTDAPEIDATMASKKGYIMEMINTSLGNPKLIAIDVTNGMIYKVITASVKKQFRWMYTRLIVIVTVIYRLLPPLHQYLEMKRNEANEYENNYLYSYSI